MIFNLVSNLDENAKLEELCSYNHVVAWQLRDALRKEGHTSNLISDNFVMSLQVPVADHTIVISNVAMIKARTEASYLQKLRKMTRDKLCLWLDSDLGTWGMFDRVLCVNLCHKRNPERYHYVGWATDPFRFYPQQTRKTVFVDPYMRGWYEGTYDDIYNVISQVLSKTQCDIYQPVETYNQGRVPWLTITRQLSQSSYFVATQIAYWGLTNLEAATAGALLVVHRKLDRPETWPSKLNHVLWETEEELTEILKGEVSIQANRKVALKNSWSKVVARIMEALK